MAARSLASGRTLASGRALIGPGAAAGMEAASGQYLSRASNSTLQMGDVDFTLGCWFKLTGVVDGGNFPLISKYSVDTDNLEYLLAVLGYPVETQFRVYGEASSDGKYDGQDFIVEPASPVVNRNDGLWHFVLLWYDKTLGKIFIQVDNGAITGKTHTGGAFAGSAEFRIGSAVDTITPTAGMACSVANAFVCKRLMGPTERADLYSRKPGWVQLGSAAVKTAMQFDGLTNFLQQATSSNVSPSGSWSLSCWIKPDQIDNARWIYATIDNGALFFRNGFAVGYNGTQGNLPEMDFYIQPAYDNDPGGFCGSQSNNPGGVVTPSPGNWIHVVFIYDDTTKEMIQVLNNQAPCVEAGSLNSPDGYTPSAVTVTCGKNLSPFLGTGFFGGLMSCMGMFSGHLSASQITALFGNGVPLRYADLGSALQAITLGYWDFGEIHQGQLDSFGSSHWSDSNLSLTAATGLIADGSQNEQDTMAAWWDLSEVSGSRVDSSGNAQTLTDNGGVPQVVGVNGSVPRILVSRILV